ncbi:mannose-6-phosphate isomerase, class I [Candidatus Pantoea edessiphila]|uniref:mannose-6-phosphate isomerase n=1 Tax=Candidatus Pantoea edessiphila TaxID=2044610 RepID=A0A2P5T148_9GAMM|nr:mannose-6-phosphate isomerase, class I [Candidatus Pantoea edessiphila]
MLKLKNSLKNYEWGSRTFLSNAYNIHNPQNLPMAELWIGINLQNPSKVYYNNKISLLSDVLKKDPYKLLGNAVAKYFGALPFLFKILCIEHPLSIQVHPNKILAKKGFIRENIKLIPLDSYKRNYKDNNYKPELIYAMRPFHALIGFRNFSEITSLLNKIINIHPCISYFQRNPNRDNLLKLLKFLLFLKGKEKLLTLNLLKSCIKSLTIEPWKTINDIIMYYPQDNGLFLFLFLNNFFLKTGEAVFIPPGTPHSYLKGIAVEVCANSDNVIRAGLTSKYVDILDFLINIKFEESSLENFLIRPKKLKNELQFTVTVNDFIFAIHNLKDEYHIINQNSMAILFCIEGNFSIINNKIHITMKSGESYFISADEMPITIKGNGCLARVFNKFD